MIKRCKNGFWLLFCMGLCALCSFQAYAQGRILDKVYMADSDSSNYLPVDPIRDATSSDAYDPDEYYDLGTDSDANDGIMLLSDHGPYDTGSISTSVVTYFSDVVGKLGPVHYVLFRYGQNEYRLYYSKDLQLTSSGEFEVDQADYIAYDTRNFTWLHGSESDFGLDPENTMVYSDLGGYPMLESAGTASWALVFVGTVFLLFTIFRSFFAQHKYQI